MKGFTWEKQWIWKYQSIWCSIERFKYANSFNNKDMQKILQAKDKRKPIYIPSSMYICNRTIDLKRYYELFNEDLFTKNSFELKESLKNIYNIPDIEKMIISKWRYCPKCIIQGYHSTLHQLSIFNNCPFHNVELVTKCPRCKKEKSYIIDFSTLEKGFECSCGYSYINTNRPLYTFKKWISDNIEFKPQGNVFLYDKEAFYLFPSLSWYLEKKLSLNVFNYSCNKFRELLFYNNFKDTHIIKYNITMKGSVTPKYNDNIYDSSRFFMMNEYISIIKSIARYIRRKKIKKDIMSFYKKNTLYLYYDYYQDKVSIDGLCYKDIDAELYAYIMWRKVVEGHEYINTIHTRLTNRASNDPQFTIKRNITETIFYRYMLNEFNLYFKAYNHNEYVSIYDYGLLVGSFQHILSILLINYYKNCLEYATMKKSLHSDQIINFEESIILPKMDFIIKFNSSNEVTLIYFKLKG